MEIAVEKRLEYSLQLLMAVKAQICRTSSEIEYNLYFHCFAVTSISSTRFELHRTRTCARALNLHRLAAPPSVRVTRINTCILAGVATKSFESAAVPVLEESSSLSISGISPIIESLQSISVWRYGATVSTSPFQGGNTGSIPVSATIPVTEEDELRRVK